MPSLLPAVVAAAVLALAAPLAQSKPDFTGTWTMDRERSESPHQGESFQEPTFVITQTDAEVTVVKIVIGVTIILEGMHHHVPKSYVYLPLGFCLVVEILQMRQSRKMAPR